ncbi:MAG: hypothetical protein A2X08_18250 [Bacteroidetes bacterium GWA2_32_17]|nr:MAG: hypothetical protein A2X08_18250 [Bacteroidetes bacterium GWA2_32_17]
MAAANTPCKTNWAVGSNLTMGKRNKHASGLTRQCKEIAQYSSAFQRYQQALQKDSDTAN